MIAHGGTYSALRVYRIHRTVTRCIRAILDFAFPSLYFGNTYKLTSASKMARRNGAIFVCVHTLQTICFAKVPVYREVCGNVLVSVEVGLWLFYYLQINKVFYVQTTHWKRTGIVRPTA